MPTVTTNQYTVTNRNDQTPRKVGRGCFLSHFTSDQKKRCGGIALHSERPPAQQKSCNARNVVHRSFYKNDKVREEEHNVLYSGNNVQDDN